MESREIARNANPVVGVTAVSAYRRNQKRPPPQPQHTQRSSSPSSADKAKKAPCADCGVAFLVFTKRARGGWNKSPHTRCQPCWKKAFDSAQHNTIESHDDTFGQLSSVSGSHNAVTLSHQIFTKGEWRRARLTAHPRAKLNIIPENKQSAPTAVDGVADSGAQSNVWSLAEYLASGYDKTSLAPVNLSLNAANKSAIRIDGAFFAEITGTTAEGKTIGAKSMIYVSRDVKGFYLSYSTMVDLGMLARDFPTLHHRQWLRKSMKFTRDSRGTIPTTTRPATPCDGGLFSEHPSKLPFTCSLENNAKMKLHIY